MKLKCVDGIVRRFSICEKIGGYDGTVHHETTEAYCVECWKSFGRHDTKILKPLFKKHTCGEQK